MMDMNESISASPAPSLPSESFFDTPSIPSQSNSQSENVFSSLNTELEVSQTLEQIYSKDKYYIL
jgi:hypothetical protein